ncbi:beta/alpha barrel domain-containing protein [Halogranum rubrum]|uniref:Uncharacterized protein n=1 Tax=Halogranum salarium B-1 TaxID=1210908 RepID=J3ETD3_9EURY|nr:hypothetical protein HSB1_43450 [Halogranum salarium B-1]
MSEISVDQRIVDSGVIATVRGVGEDVVTDAARAIAAGGVSLDNAAAFFDAGAVALSVGSAIVDNIAIAAGDFVAVAEEYQ